MLELLVRSRCRNEQTFAVSSCQATDDAGSGDGRVADWDHILQLGFED